MNNLKKDWFNTWFDSPFYHLLYKHRDHQEASLFIDKLIAKLQLKKGSKVMDLACGKGRHSNYLNALGFEVVGLDLSSQNIKIASQNTSQTLQFYEHDMRNVFKKEEFDAVFNFFTSFGYFENNEENFNAIHAVAQALKKEGRLILDFLNPYTVIHNLISEEVKTIENIEFHINRYVNSNNFIIKDIRFDKDGEQYHFQEKVKAIRRMEFLDFFRRANLKIIEVYGNYNLDSYHPTTSERMIFIAEK